MKKISAVITAISGEEKYLPSCLSSIKNFASEIIIIDMSSSQEIALAAKKYKAKVYKHTFINYVEPVRNFGISKVKTKNQAKSLPWILILDPDEEIPRTLLVRLKEVVERDEADYVRIPRSNIVFGKTLRHSRWWPDYNIRFFKKGAVIWDDSIHSVPITKGKGIDLEAKTQFAIIHHHYNSIELYIERMNRYTSIQAVSRSKEYNFSWKDLITRPSGEFLSRFFAAEGYRDGVHGLALSLLQSFYELVTYLKIWQIEKFKEENMKIDEVIKEIEKTKKEFNYWENDAEFRQRHGIIPRIKRKLKL